MTNEQVSVPNHHAHHPGFAGVGGLFAAASMVLGREGDAEIVARLSGLRPDDTVVDIGCGPGTAARRAARLGAAVTAVDPASVMLWVARLLANPGGRIRYRYGSAEALPLEDGAATVVWSIACVHHWGDLDAGLREARRVLAAGGRFVALERHTTTGAQGLASHGWTDDQAHQFAERCVDVGFLDPAVATHTSGRRRTVSVTARTA